MKPQPSYQKLRGGYYTPTEVAEFLSKWAIRSPQDSILEPSCGDGAFVDSAAKRLVQLGTRLRQIAEQVWGYEIDPFEAAHAANRLRTLGIKKGKVRIHSGDFFAGCEQNLEKQQFDAVVGNPPFIRYQNFPESQRSVAFDIMQRAGLNPNRLTNAWVPFVVCSALLLKSEGRMAMVIPAELLQVNYAAELRLFLSEYFKRITVLTFRRLTFDQIQQEVVLLLAERGNGKKAGIEVLEFGGIRELSQYNPDSFGLNGFKSVDHSREKWTQYYLSQQEIELLRVLSNDRRLSKLGSIAETDIGIVTGMNDFFVLTDNQVRENRLEEFTRPLVSRSNQLRGISFKRSDWRLNARSGLPAYLLDLPRCEAAKLPASARKYILAGEAANVHGGYKCRIRKLWYVLPSVYVPGGFLLRQIHRYPKLIVNEAGVTSTDTIHRVRFQKGVNRHQVAAAFLNSLTFAFSEVLGRSYGGGVLELEPNEANRLPIPLIHSDRLDTKQVDAAIRTGDIDRVLEETDLVLLGSGLNLSNQEIAMLRTIWKKLQARRIGRRNGTNAVG